jgi:hypothetical protein
MIKIRIQVILYGYSYFGIFIHKKIMPFANATGKLTKPYGINSQPAAGK